MMQQTNEEKAAALQRTQKAMKEMMQELVVKEITVAIAAEKTALETLVNTVRGFDTQVKNALKELPEALTKKIGTDFFKGDDSDDFGDFDSFDDACDVDVHKILTEQIIAPISCIPNLTKAQIDLTKNIKIAQGTTTGEFKTAQENITKKLQETNAVTLGKLEQSHKDTCNVFATAQTATITAIQTNVQANTQKNLSALNGHTTTISNQLLSLQKEADALKAGIATLQKSDAEYLRQLQATTTQVRAVEVANEKQFSTIHNKLHNLQNQFNTAEKSIGQLPSLLTPIQPLEKTARDKDVANFCETTDGEQVVQTANLFTEVYFLKAQLETQSAQFAELHLKQQKVLWVSLVAQGITMLGVLAGVLCYIF